MSRDKVPSTLNTWIEEQLDGGESGRTRVHRHVREVYAPLLEVHFEGRDLSWLGKADDVVEGYFADRLAGEGFFADWRESGERLRHRLITDFFHYLLELGRRRQPLPQEGSLEPGVRGAVEEVRGEIDRSFATRVVRLALTDAREVCQSVGLEQHWRVFYLHHYEGSSFEQIVADLDIDTDRASTMARTVAERFATVLRDLLARDGAGEGEIDREIDALLAALAVGSKLDRGRTR